MKVLWAPWRIDYIISSKPDNCVFCVHEKDKAHDEANLILFRGKYSFVIMNKYPYTNGHLLVVPYRHSSDFLSLSKKESEEIMELLQKSNQVLNSCFRPQGINIGLNLGQAAGAGILEHLHFHLVPRWIGDASFMAMFDDVRIISEHLNSTYVKLKKYFFNID